MALAGGLRVIDKGGAAVADSPIVDELDLARLEIEIDREAVIVKDLEDRGDRCFPFAVDRLALHRIAADDLVDTEPRLQIAGILENGCGKNRAFAGSILPLAVEPERRVQPRQMVAILRE